MIRLVSFDMVGTFLNSQNDYDRERFQVLLPKLLEKGIRVVANSGNQYQQIQSFFKGFEEDVVIVSEVGAQIYEKGQRIYSRHFDRDIVEEMVELFAKKDLLSRCSVSGLESLYFEEGADAAFKTLIKKTQPCLDRNSDLAGFTR